MSMRESTSIELPSALSGSNALMAWLGVASTRTVTTRAAFGADWGNAALASAVNNAIGADVRATFMRSFIQHGEKPNLTRISRTATASDRLTPQPARNILPSRSGRTRVRAKD